MFFVPVNYATEQALFKIAGNRCQWFYLDRTRCQNTQSLKVHHRNYKSVGNETLDDVSLLCPTHHLHADIIRKKYVNQREDVIKDWLRNVMHLKRKKMPEPNFSRFASRTSDLWNRFAEEWEMRDDPNYLDWRDYLMELCTGDKYAFNVFADMLHEMDEQSEKWKKELAEMKEYYKEENVVKRALEKLTYQMSLFWRG